MLRFLSEIMVPIIIARQHITPTDFQLRSLLKVTMLLANIAVRNSVALMQTKNPESSNPYRLANFEALQPGRQGQDPRGNSTQITNPRLNTREPQGPKSQAVPPIAVHRPAHENAADGRYVPKPKPWSPPRPPRPDAPNSSTLSVASAILSRASRYNASQANNNNKDKAPQYPSVRETGFSGPNTLSEIIKILEVYCTGRGPSSDLVNVPKEIIVEKLKAEDVLAAVWEEPRFWEMVAKDGCAEKMVGLLGCAVMDLVGRDVNDGGHGEDEERVIMWCIG
ncbi:MAG: hypothetical protein Q9188_006678 [Gyalolechia gomerana]